MNRIALLLLATAVLTAGCNSTATRAPDPQPNGWSQCPDERPQICTRIYNPVCAWLPGTGEWKTYASDCTACADANVAGHIPGKCE